MHFIVSWDIHGTGETWNHINSRLLLVLSPYNPVRPVNTFYVMRGDEYQRRTVINGLQDVARSALVTTHVIVSPLMSGGAYDGFLPANLWAELNARAAS